MPRNEEGCAPIRRGILDHYPALGAYGVALYAWLILKMNPETRRVETTTAEMREALATGPNQITRTLLYLEEHGYIDYIRGNGSYKSIIFVCKPKCPTTGVECPLAGAISPCLSMAETVREVAYAVRADEELAKSAVVLRVYKVWQEAGVMKHQKVTKQMGTAVKKAVKDFGEELVIEAIRNYATVVHSKEHWFNYHYTLTDFLARRGGNNIERFCTDARPLENFRGAKEAPGTTTSGKYAEL